jgi:hypothetical protein
VSFKSNVKMIGSLLMAAGLGSMLLTRTGELVVYWFGVLLVYGFWINKMWDDGA